ncbi:MAG TPA: ABC transporter ATP-binding protein [Pseudonocardia sp.]|uniref:ABC transporter ATP-binding protein n=1 Tax=Pseudonocardia sp. TaxID=60912 RepID=UPI002ED86C10
MVALDNAGHSPGRPVTGAVAGARQPDTLDLVVDATDLRVSLSRNGRRFEVLRGVDLRIRRGEILGLVGESGSGKSVLSLAMLGLLPATSAPELTGRLRVTGADMLTGDAEARRVNRRDHLGAVFQDPMTSLNPTMRVGRQVIEAAGGVEEAVRLLDLVGVPDARKRMSSFPHELSGGLRQRVMIAMAVAGDPDLVIADEPTTALDVTVQAQVLGLLRGLRDELGCSVLMITHDLGVAAQVADRVAVMYAGRLAELGPTESVLTEPAHPYTAGLLRSRLSLTTDRTAALVTVPGTPPLPTAVPAGCAYASRCPSVMDSCRTELPELEPFDTGAEAGVVDATAEPAHLRACFADLATVHLLASEPHPPTGAEPHLPTGGTEPVPAAQTLHVLREGEGVCASGTAAGSAAAGSLAAGSPAAGSPAVGVRRVEKVFRVKVGRSFGARGRLAALRRVSLEIAEGESVALVGESGSGKSTLLRVIAGLERADGGEVSLGPGSRPQMVFQDAGASLTPWLTVGALLDERLRQEKLTRTQRRERVLASLATVGLPEEVAEVRAGELSGGQRQRVALARATVVPPELLLCDEPTSALDVSLAASVLNLIRDLRASLGMAVLFVTHDLSVARIVADRIAVMYLGKIVEVGAAEELIAAPRHPYTQALVGAVPGFGVAPVAARGEPASPLSPPSGCEFHPRCPIAIEACAQPELEVPLELPPPRHPADPGGELHRVACIRAGRAF